MKKAFLYLAFTVAACISGPAQAFSTTFAQWDEMTKDQQSKLIAARGSTIYGWLKVHQPAIAKCMYEKFDIGKVKNKPSDALIELNKKINGVSPEDRPKYHVEALMANYIVDDLCAGLETKPEAVQQPTNSAK